MKSYFTFSGTVIFLLSCIASTSAQYIDQFPDSNARWINGYVSPDIGLASTTNYCLTSEDTVINSLNYTKVDTCEIGYKGALRNDSGEVYFVPRDSIGEFLLYDFTAQEGDTIDNIYFEIFEVEEPTIGYAIVESVDDYQIQILLKSYEDVVIGDGYWLKNIGESSGLFRPPWPLLGAGGFYELTCFSHNDTTFLYEQESGTCALDLTVPKIKDSEIEIYPNPTRDKVTCRIKNSLNPVEITLVNTLGKPEEVTFTNSGSQIEIDLSALPGGIYFLKIMVGNQLFSSKILKQN